jgi:3-hydroxyisobutyrate dehydrogenase-like beta-hydroxyacid dehydrogenase
MIASFQNVSIIGVGQMGNGIAKKIDQIGKLKSIFEINSELLDDFENRTDLNINNTENGLKDCNIHLFIVPSTKEIRHFLFDSHGIDKITSGSIIVDLTTSNPEESIKLAEECFNSDAYKNAAKNRRNGSGEVEIVFVEAN